LKKHSQPAEGHAQGISSAQLKEIVLSTLEESKAQDVRSLDVAGSSPLTDVFVIATGSSTRHVKTMADKLVEAAKANGVQPLGVEGERGAQWVLVDLNDIIVHLMLPQARAFYNLEKLWEMARDSRSDAHLA
jgi:ribosome-associated protein